MDRAHHLGQPVSIHVGTEADAGDWAQLRHELWPNSRLSEHAADIAAFMAKPDETLNLIATDEDGRAIGFAEASLRHDYVNGCNSSPVAFLEGIYVRPEQRRMGFAKQLVAAVEAWAIQQKCSELASDANIANQTSHSMHQALGFVETQRVVYFRKGLSSAE